MKKTFVLFIGLVFVLLSTGLAGAFVLFEDNFDDGNLDGWTHIPDSVGDDHGEWSVVDVGGNLALKFDADPIQHYASFLVADSVVMPESFTLEFDATTLLDDDGMHYIAAYMHFYDHDNHLIGGFRQGPPSDVLLLNRRN